MSRADQLEVPSTGVLQSIVQILKDEGFVKGYRVVTEQNINRIRIALKPPSEAGHVIKGMRRISRPGRRVYVGKDEIPVVKNGFGIAVISTSKGVMTGEKARKLSIGGELLCELW
jgi:small subunit ribosomal protein S8